MHVARWSLRWLVAAVLVLQGSAAVAAEITVSAAASLTDAFKAIGAAFEASHPQTQVQFNFAASGALLQQIVRGAPVDVFASADEETMNQAERQRLLLAGSRADIATNSLVVIVPRDAARVPRTVADLTAASFARIAIGVPASVPVGRYTKAALETAELWAALEPKTIGAQSVRQVLDYVVRGEVDAGFVYGTDAALMAGKLQLAFNVPTATPVRYPIAVLADSAQPAAAREFVAFVLSPPGQSILARFGFGKP